MLATKNPARWLSAISVAVAIAILSGCTASGPRALLDGDRALRDGKVPRAIEKLKLATELMPDEPRAWNFLGLAYHQGGQPQIAEKAYRQALARDRSNRVAVAHFNLGCLLLEQGNAGAAADELRSFTMITNSPLAWIKLGEAQSRMRQYDSAERSFMTALRLGVKELQPVVWNDLGVLAAQRNRMREASQNFNNALALNSKFAPAALNSAVLSQQAFGAKQTALQRYREYLALAPKAANADAVNALARQLESELAPKPIVPTNVIVQMPATNPAPGAAVSNRVATPVTNPPPRLVATPSTNTPPVRVVPTPQTNVAVAPRVPATTSAPPPSLPMTVVSVAPPPPVVIATSSPSSVARAAAPPTNPPSPLVTGSSIPAQTGAEPNAKPGLFQRMNPFRAKPERGIASETGRVVVASVPGNPVIPSANVAKTFAHYRYANPPTPKAGNRAEAERAFQQAVKAIKAANTNEALLDYQLAINADPAFLDAQYNLALLTQSGDAKRSLPLWETVLAIEPDSINARYNFALALKQADFPHEAAAELERIIEAKPSEARAHLTLANLYAQQLGQMRRARDHYMKVLELDPRNSQAAAIRFWLAANQ